MRQHVRIGVGACAAFLVMACARVATGQNTYGTREPTTYTIGEWEFLPVDSTQTYSDVSVAAGAGTGGFNVRRYSTGGDSGFFAGPHLPDGALLDSIQYDLCDSNTQDLHWSASFYKCTSYDGLCEVIGIPMQSNSSDEIPCSSYSQGIAPLNVVVDNNGYRLMVLVKPGADDATNALLGVKIVYKLQVSPPPANATFADVPTDHPFFQFVEALARAGITAGCGNGNFCPDEPVTRAQAATFLSKGLGLQWPGPVEPQLGVQGADGK